MKTILSVFLINVFALALHGSPEKKRDLVTLEDIRTYKPGKDDPFDGLPTDVGLLKRLESALKVANELPKNLDQSVIEDALKAAIEDLRCDWECFARDNWRGPFIGPVFGDGGPKLDLTGEDARKSWEESPWKHTKPTDKEGNVIDWSKVRKVTPLGVSLMTEGGFKWISFTELNDDFDDVFGWSEDMEKEAVESRSKADAEATREIAESEPVAKVVPDQFQSETPSSVSI